MLEFIINGGAYKLPLLILAIVIIVLSIKKAVELFGKKKLTKIQLESGLDAILFWGGISAMFGFFSAFFGMYQAVSSVIAVKGESISPSIVWAGIKSCLFLINFGLVNFIVSAIIWFILRVRHKKLTSKKEK